MNCFKSTGENERFMLCEPTYLTIGANGQGPAIRFDEKLETGRSYCSETFQNDILTLETEGAFKDTFRIDELEVYII